MKKLFTLLTLLVAIVTGAWAADETYTLTGYSSSITNGYTVNIGGAYVGRSGSNYTPDATNGLPTGNSKIFAAFKLNQKAKINTVFVWTKTNGDLSDKSISLVSLTEADYNKLVTAAGGETKYSNVTFTDNQTATVECLRANANVDFDVPFTNAVEAGYYAVYTASSVNSLAYIKRIEITYDSDPGDTRTNLVGAWTNDAPTFEYGEAATVPTFDVTPTTATPGTHYSVAYSLVSGSNVTVDATNGITAIDTETAGTSVVKATINVLDGDNYKATTTEYTTTITVGAKPGTEPITLFSANATVSSNVSIPASTSNREITSTEATITGGKMYVNNGQTSNKNLIVSNNSGSFCLTNTNTYFKVELTQPLQAGDIITTKAGGSTGYGVRVYSTEGSGTSYPSGDYASLVTTASGFVDAKSYTISTSDDYLVGKTVLYLYRATGNSTYFDEFTITRPVIDEDAPALTVAPDALSFTEAGNKTFTITGVNLTNGTYNITVPTGFTANPATYTVADGVVNQEVTVTYAPTANTPTTAGTITVTNGDNLEASVELTYYALVNPVAQTTVSEAKTWDIENDITATKDVAAATETLYANLLDLTFAETFDATSLLVQAATAYRTGYKCVQDGTLKFTTTVPGTVTVTFASTGSNNTGRYLIVNGVQGEVEGATSGDHSVESFEVEAGDVTISRTSALRYYKVEFVPAVSTIPVTITDAKYATFVPSAAVTFEDADVKGYAAVYNSTKGSAELVEVTAVPAGTPVVVYAAKADTYDLNIASEATAPAQNNLKVSDGTVKGDMQTIYGLKNGAQGVGFYPVTLNATIAAGKVYLQIPASEGAREFIGFGGEEIVTGIDAIENGTFDNDAPAYNLAGQKVGKGYKGIVIINGKKVVK